MELEPYDWNYSDSPHSPLSPESPFQSTPHYDDSLLSSQSQLPNQSTLPSINHPLRSVLDSQGLAVTISADLPIEQSDRLIESINQFMHEVFTYGKNWSIIQTACLIDRRCVLAQIFYCDYLIANECLSQALPILESLNATYNPSLNRSHNQSTNQLNERELLYLKAYTQWLTGKKKSFLSFLTIIKKYPNDLFALKKAQLLAFLQTDFPLMLSLFDGSIDRLIDLKDVPSGQSSQSSHPSPFESRPFYHGMAAFAYEENGLIEKAIESSKKALQLYPNDVWAHHSMAHCLLHEGELTAGLAYMRSEQLLGCLNDCMSFMVTHAAFHEALFLVELMDWQQCEELFWSRIWIKDHSVSQSSKQLTKQSVGQSNHSSTDSSFDQSTSHDHEDESSLHEQANYQSTDHSDESDQPPTVIELITNTIHHSIRQLIHHKSSSRVDTNDELVRQSIDQSINQSINAPFPSHDKARSEDQLNALLVTWKWELRQHSQSGQLSDQSINHAAAWQSEQFQSINMSILQSIDHTLQKNNSQSTTPPSRPLHLGLFGLCWLHCLARSGSVSESIDYLKQISQSVNQMSAPIGSNRRSKHQSIYLPLARAILISYLPHDQSIDLDELGIDIQSINHSNPSSVNQSINNHEIAYHLAHPVITAYQSYTRKMTDHRSINQSIKQSIRKFDQLTIQTNQSNTKPVSQPANQSINQSINGRHVLQMIGGSGEQRSVINDWWMEILLSTNRFDQAIDQSNVVIDERKGRGCAHFQQIIRYCETNQLTNQS